MYVAFMEIWAEDGFKKSSQPSGGVWIFCGTTQIYVCWKASEKIQIQIEDWFNFSLWIYIR